MATQPLLVKHVRVCHVISYALYYRIFRTTLGVVWGEGASRMSPPFHRGEQESQRLGDLPGVTQHREVKRKGQNSNPKRGLFPTPSFPITQKACCYPVGMVDTELKVVRPGCVLTVTMALSLGIQ